MYEPPLPQLLSRSLRSSLLVVVCSTSTVAASAGSTFFVGVFVILFILSVEVGIRIQVGQTVVLTLAPKLKSYETSRNQFSLLDINELYESLHRFCK
ncbi:hypothetical protein P692DRAFT_201926952 [Suillus brevipes Sb2]|nr:hypothetical protein P692DRAFT_201926952 [Suillus brevipes Sb2]